MANEIDAQSALLLIQKGIDEESKGNHKAAFYCILQGILLDPLLKEEYKSTFITSLSHYGLELEAERKYGELFNRYEEALEVYKEDDFILSNIGSHLLRLNRPYEASFYIRRSLRVNPTSLITWRNLENANIALVPQWHFRMLNDSKRNSAYLTAIRKRIGEGHKKVLDIGAGTGILSLFAVRSGAEEIYACDFSEVMIDIASEVLEFNQGAHTIKLINKVSTDLVIPKDLHKVSLIVTETMDAGLFGEKILESLLHAKEHLLDPNGVIIPYSSSVHAMLIQSDFLARKRNLASHQDNKRQKLDKLLSISLLNYDSFNEEPYDTEILNTLPGGFKQLSEPVEVVSVNFNDINDMKRVRDNKVIKVSFTCSQSGYIDAVVFWFKATLCDDILLSNSPFDLECCWDQAIVHLDGLRLLEKGDCVEVTFFFHNGVLSARLEPARVGASLSEKSIRYINTFARMYEGIENNLGMERLNVLDHCKFPLGGLHLAKTINAEVVWPSCDGLVGVVEELQKMNEVNIKYSTQDVPPDIIFYDVINIQGEIREGELYKLRELRRLHPNSCFIPSSISIVCRLISSSSLKNWVEVNDSNLQGFTVAPFINLHKVHHILEVNSRKITKPFTDRVCMTSLTVDQLISTDQWRFEQEIVSTEDGIIDAVQYWVEWKVFSNHFSSWDENPYGAPVVEMLLPMTVKRGTPIKIKMIYETSIIKFFAIKAS